MKTILFFVALYFGFNSSVVLSAEDNIAPIDVKIIAEVKTASIEMTSLTSTLSVFGDIQPDTDQIITLSIPYAGLINRVWVQVGQQVKKGDNLFTVSTTPTVKVSYLQTKVAVTYAKNELNRQQKLVLSHLSTNSQVAMARKKLQDAQINLQSLKQQGIDHNQRIFKAPIDGIIILLNLQSGQRVQPDSSVVQIANKQKWVVHLGVEPEDISQLKIGMKVSLASAFDPKLNFNAQISQINAVLNPITHLVDVLVPIPEKKATFFVLGSRLKGAIQLQQHTGMTIPRSAILHDDSGDFVFRITQGKAEKVSITIGISRHQSVEITHGLNANDRIIIHGNYELEDGMTVHEVLP